MPYSISKVIHHSVSNGNKYLLDSNIWIEVLTSRNANSPRHKQYLKLFQQIISNNELRIILPALMVSEILNRILREVYLKKYALKNGFSKDSIIPSDYYKNVYRSSEDFKTSYNLLCDDISNYINSIDLVQDEFGSKITFSDVLCDPPTGLDFNDYYYYTLALKNDYIIVTDDKDFWIPDVRVVTESQSLIQKMYAETGRLANLNSPLI